MDETTAVFSIGDPRPVTDPRLLPAVSADEEAAFLGGLVAGDDQPDGAAGPVGTVGTVDAEQADDGPLPTEAELDALVAGMTVDAVDEVGFDDADLADLTTALDVDVEAALGVATAGSPS